MKSSPGGAKDHGTYFAQCHYRVVFSTKQRAKLIGMDIRVSPLPGLVLPLSCPTAYAVGYNMPPLPGLDRVVYVDQ